MRPNAPYFSIYVSYHILLYCLCFFPKCFSLFSNLPMYSENNGKTDREQCFQCSTGIFLYKFAHGLLFTVSDICTWTHIYRRPQVGAFLAEPVALEMLVSPRQGEAHVLEVCHIMSKLLEIMVLGFTSHTPLTYKWTIPN